MQRGKRPNKSKKQKYQVFFTFKDGTNYLGEVSLTSDRKRAEIKSTNETVWMPLDE